MKFYIDKNYFVYRNRKNIYIVGSSMGGLILMYVICEYFKIFGGVVCLFMYWIGIFMFENNLVLSFFLSYFINNFLNFKKYKLYFDCGD